MEKITLFNQKTSDYIVKKNQIIFAGKILTLLKRNKDSDDNWDYYIDDETKQTYYIAHKKSNCDSGWFGSLDHYNNIMTSRGV